jgi:hypothetical protein
MAISRQGVFAVTFTSNGAGEVVADIKKVGTETSAARKQLDSARQSADDTGGAFAGLGAQAKTALAGIGVAAVVQFATRSVVEFQKLEGQITTFTGSFEKTREMFARFRSENERTGLNVADSAQSWITLRTQGIEPTAERLRAIGNISAQTGRSIEEVANAYGAAARGQFRQLTQLGAQFREVNDEVVVRFTDGSTRIINSADDATAALDRLGNTDFAGAKARDADTLAGAFDDLRTAGSELSVTLLSDTGVAGGLTNLVQLLAQVTTQVARTGDNVRQLAKDFGEATEEITREGPGILSIFGNFRAPFVGRAAFTRPVSSSDGAPAASPAAPGQAEETQRISKAVAELVAELDKQSAAYGKTRAAALELAKAQALSKATNDAERKAITASYDALIQTIKANDAAAAATTARGKATDEANKKDEEAQRKKQEQILALERLKESLYGITPEIATYREEVTDLVAAFNAGLISQEEYIRLLDKSKEKFSALAADTNDVAEKVIGEPRTYADLAQRQVDEFGEVWEQGVQTLGESLTGIFRDIFGEAGDDVAALFDQVFGTGNGRSGRNFASTVRRDSGQLGRSFELDPGFTGPATAQGGQADPNVGTSIANIAQQLGPAVGTAVGGGGQGAQLGSAIGGALGSVFGPIGSIVGSILGGFIGGLFDDDPKPRITVGGTGRQQATGTSAFGQIGASTRDVDITGAEVVDAIRSFDNSIATLLNAGERAAVTGALRGFSGRSDGDDVSVEEILGQRLAVIIRTAEPAFASFLNAITDVEERVRQFEGLRAIRDQIEDIDQVIAEAFGTPVEAQAARLANLQSSISDAADTLAGAIDANDFAAAAEASTELQRAVLDLASAQIDAAVQLESALQQLDASSRRFALDIASRIAQVTGSGGGAVIGLLEGNLATTRQGALNSRTPEQSLQYLSEFIATVDAWLQQSTAEVQRLLALQMQAFDEERDGILSEAQLRLEAANTYNATIGQIQQDLNAAMLSALQEQLRLAQQWENVLERSEQLLDSLRFGAANPVGLSSQFANLGSEADALFAQFGSATGSNRVDIANRLLEILQQQQQVGASLFDRPSDESVALYNQILARINAVREVAQPEADRVAEIQNRIAELQAQTVGAVNTLTDATYFLTAEERLRLEAIEDERRLAEEAAQAALDDINETAAEYYRWAQTRGVELQTQQREILQEQLDALTGGVDIQSFILGVQRQSRDALINIRDNLQRFLDSIAVVGGIVGPGGPGGGGPGGPGGGGPGGPTNPIGSAAIVNIGDINVSTGSGDPEQIGAAVRTAIMQQLPVMASALKRELKTA